MVAKVTGKSKSPSKTVKKPRAGKKSSQETAGQMRFSDDAIAQNAYMLWRERGGDAIKNWLDAESQLKQNQQR